MTTQIFEQVLKKEGDNIISKMAILFNLDTDQLTKDLNKYCGNVPCNLFVDIKLNNPWTYLVISRINELKFLTEEQRIRKEKLKKLNKLNLLNENS